MNLIGRCVIVEVVDMLRLVDDLHLIIEIAFIFVENLADAFKFFLIEVKLFVLIQI